MIEWLLNLTSTVKNIIAVFIGGLVFYLLRKNNNLKVENNLLKIDVQNFKKNSNTNKKIFKALSEDSDVKLTDNIKRMRRNEL
jgi:hypothetical protein